MKQARLLFLLLALLAFASASPAPRPAARANRDYALFFAVNDYRPGSGFEPLSKPNKAVPDNMVLVRGGSFLMGDQFGDGDSNEKPAHTVMLRDFYLGRTELTVGEFRTFVEASGYQTDAEKGDGSYILNSSGSSKKSDVNWRHNEEGKPHSADDYPVIHVIWNDAVAYCNWLSER